MPKGARSLCSYSSIDLTEAALLPKLARGEAGAFGHGGELGPDHVGIDRGLPDPGAVAAIAAGDDGLAPDESGIAGKALRHQLRMLDEVRFRLEHAGNEHLARRQLHALEERPFMGVARIGRFEGNGAGARL